VADSSLGGVNGSEEVEAFSPLDLISQILALELNNIYLPSTSIATSESAVLKLARPLIHQPSLPRNKNPTQWLNTLVTTLSEIMTGDVGQPESTPDQI